MKFVPFFIAASICLHGQNPLTDIVKARYESVKQNLIASAEAMPETEYNFKLTPAQRPFGKWIEHTIDMTYSGCSSMRGLTHLMRPAPDDNKASLVEVLKKAFEYCDESLKDMTDQKALTEVPMGDKKVYPVTYMVSLVSGLNEHYGNVVGYLRTKGITPPSSAHAGH